VLYSPATCIHQLEECYAAMGWSALAVCLLVVAPGARVVSAPVTVSAAGKPVQASADRTGEVVTGRLTPVLDALDARPSFLKAEGRLSAMAPDGTQFQARAGDKQMLVNGQPRPVSTAFSLADNDLVGPISEVVEALGAVARFEAAANELRVAHRLTQVEAFASDESAMVHVRLSAPAKAGLHALDNPARAYVDFPGLTWNGGTETMQIGGTGGLKRVRWALFQAWPPIARVVVDLEEGAEVSLAQVADRLFVISVRPRSAPAPTKPASLAGAHIIVDPAGGGTDGGARGTSAIEKAVALDVAIRLAVRLMNAGAVVTLTRDSDVAVGRRERAALAKEVKADLAVTIGCGAGQTPDERGIGSAYSADTGAALAGALQAALVRELGAKDRGVAKAAEAGLPGVSCPSVTCRIGFLTSPDDEKLLASPDYRERIAAALTEGIGGYLLSSG